MTITELLNVEHGVFLAQLAHLREQLRRMAPPGEIAAIVATLGRAVAVHRAVEEEFLYPEIERACGPGFPPLAVMNHEHREIESAIEQAARGALDTPDAYRFADVLEDHIRKEIAVLFPTAEQAIPRGRLEELARAAVDSVHERAGVGR
jgi:hemerythrin-like domain-containing protein